MRVPVELRREDNGVPISGATSDISLGRCYIGMMFTLAKNIKLGIGMKIGGTVLALGTLVTGDPNAWNRIKFTKTLPEDQAELRRYLEAAPQGSQSSTLVSLFCACVLSLSSTPMRSRMSCSSLLLT